MAEIKANATLVLSNAFQTLFSTGNILGLTISIMRLTNTTAGAVTVSICYVPSGSSASTSNAIMWDFSVPANNFIEFGEGDILNSTVTIQAKAASANAIVLKMSGIQS